MTRDRQRDDMQPAAPDAADRVGAPAALPPIALEAVQSGDPDRIADLLEESPALRGPVMTMLHQRFGAAFVQAVLARPPRKPPAPPPVMATAPVPAAAPAMAAEPAKAVADPKGPEHD